MTIKAALRASTLALLTLTGCSHLSASQCHLPALPGDVMAPPPKASFLDRMEDMLGYGQTVSSPSLATPSASVSSSKHASNS